jgi:hypothetical protein
MVVIAAGNSPLGTVQLTRSSLGQYQYQVLQSGRPADSGFLAEK